MHRALSSRWLKTALRIGDRSCMSEVPVFLCPALGRGHFDSGTLLNKSQQLQYRQKRCLHSHTEAVVHTTPPPPQQPKAIRKLPLQCTGCGAFSQTADAGQAGYFNSERKAVRTFLGLETGHEEEEMKKKMRKREEDKVLEEAIQSLDAKGLEDIGIDPKTLQYGQLLGPEEPAPSPEVRVPLCDRCHNLVHHQIGTSIYHPSVDSLRETIDESPYKYNHIYHVIDAADFPMSVVPRLHRLLGDVSLRHKNRRSRADRYYKDRKFEMSFIVTRSDLLAPTKEQVDNLMPYLREVLRGALGEFGHVVRLGNMRCVSAKRSWWTKTLKEEIWERGGAGWMVGKVNVGKSQLFEAVFPKGRSSATSPKHLIEVPMLPRLQDIGATEQPADSPLLYEDQGLDVHDLLPPAQPESNYPAMPTVSALPGTTASPIRIPFGNGKGELIDLPGLARSDLELFVQEEHRPSLILKDRIKPEQQVIKPGQSILLGGFIRITPRTPDLIFLGYNFTPLTAHLTATEKAIGFQDQTRTAPTVENISVPGTGEKIQHAGTFDLRYDVTQKRSGPITRKHVGGRRVEDLPYRVLAIDLLIEGCGWVEIVAQVRTWQLYERQRKQQALPVDPFAVMEGTPERQDAPRDNVPDNDPDDYSDDNPENLNWPAVDVYTPEGRFIGSRAPMNGYLLNKTLIQAKNKRSRPRKSMKNAKKNEKIAMRSAAATTH